MRLYDNSDIVVWGALVVLGVRVLCWEEYTTARAAGSEKLRQETWVWDENSGDHEMHGQKRNTLRKPLRNLNIKLQMTKIDHCWIYRLFIQQ